MVIVFSVLRVGLSAYVWPSLTYALHIEHSLDALCSRAGLPGWRASRSRDFVRRDRASDLLLARVGGGGGQPPSCWCRGKRRECRASGSRPSRTHCVSPGRLPVSSRLPPPPSVHPQGESTALLLVSGVGSGRDWLWNRKVTPSLSLLLGSSSPSPSALRSQGLGSCRETRSHLSVSKAGVLPTSSRG